MVAVSSEERIGPGSVVLVVGPSGAGKDTLIANVRARFAEDDRVVFPMRVISRPPHAAEAHVPTTAEAFARDAARDRYALSWSAHGLAYALPLEVDEHVRAGRVVVANVSRAAVPLARLRYARVEVVYIDAPLDIRLERLAARGRETSEEIESRLARSVASFDPSSADAIVHNDGAIDAAAAQLAAVVRARL